jgi:hypothetical protein
LNALSSPWAVLIDIAGFGLIYAVISELRSTFRKTHV